MLTSTLGPDGSFRLLPMMRCPVFLLLTVPTKLNTATLQDQLLAFVVQAMSP